MRRRYRAGGAMTTSRSEKTISKKSPAGPVNLGRRAHQGTRRRRAEQSGGLGQKGSCTRVRVQFGIVQPFHDVYYRLDRPIPVELSIAFSWCLDSGPHILKFPPTKNWRPMIAVGKGGLLLLPKVGADDSI